MRKHGRVDANHAEIVRALRAAGCSVLSLAAIGGGAPDLLVARNGRTWLFEIKDEKQSPSKRKLNALQVEFRVKWQGPVHLIENAQTALWHVGS